MATKKQKRASDSKARKRKKKVRLTWLVVIGLTALAFFVFLFLTISEFLESPLSDKETPAKKRERQQVTLFFSDPNERFLIPEKRLIPKPAGADSQAAEIVKALIDGPQSHLVRTLPEDTKLLGVKVLQGTASVDFDASLVQKHPGGSASEMATIYSLTNSLTSSMPSIQRVRILINGKGHETLKGHMDTSRAFTLNKELIRTSSGE